MTLRRRVLAFLIVVTAASVTSLTGCSSHPDPWEKLPGPPRVVVSIPPLYSFVKQVGGERVGVISLCTTKGPHAYTPDTRDSLLLRKADLLLGIGLELDERFLDKLKHDSGNAKLKYVELGESDGMDEKLIHLEKKSGAKEHTDHSHGDNDPHVWLGIDTTKLMVEAIAKELAAIDPANAAEYKENAKKYCAKLDKLQAEYVEKLAGKKDRRILPLHDSLRYFGRSFGLEVAEAIEIAPGEAPTSPRLRDIVELCADEKKPIHYIATEPQFESKAATTIETTLKEKNLRVELFEIDPLETIGENEHLDADWYEKKMRQNLDTLVEKLK